ncbi:MAG: MoxR family ATPase [Spirochaetaceae bacterium]
MDLTAGNVIINQIIENIQKVMVGDKEPIELMCMALICEGHILIEDVPGTGKTTLALALSKTIGGNFKRISCTPDVMPTDITGFTMYNPKTQEFEYKEGAIMANLFLADEINRTPPKTQSGLLEAMEERFVTVDGIRHTLPSPFLVIATQNPIEYLGTYPLPEAQLDRFLLKIKIGYPTKDNEKEIIRRFGSTNPLDTLKSMATPKEIEEVKNLVNNILIAENVMDYIVNLVAATRTNKDLLLGLSPRATLWLAKVSKAWAFYQGRDFVIPDDVKYIFIHVCSHRVSVKSEAKYENITSNSILTDILKRVGIPG